MPVAIVFAAQRSGTHALGSILSQQEGVRYLGEIFHAERRDADSFWGFLDASPIAQTLYCSPGGHFDVYKLYCTHVHELSGRRLCILDIKYGSMHHFKEPWQHPAVRPSIISYSIELHQPILHLCRRNALKVLLSKKLAEKNQIWHTKDLRELRYRKVRLEPHEALLFCDKMVAAHSCIERYLSGVRHIELDYEDLFDGHSKLKAFARRKIAKSFQIADIPQIKSKYMKQTLSDCRRRSRISTRYAKHLNHHNTDSWWWICNNIPGGLSIDRQMVGEHGGLDVDVGSR